MNEREEILNGLILELRRGTIILGVLSQLGEPKYGYSLVQSLEDKGFVLDAGTLYPLLRRLEKQELLTSSWEMGAAKPRKYYVLSENGKEVYRTLCAEWDKMVRSMEVMMKNGGKNDDEK